MNDFKTKPEIVESIPITEENFTEATGKRYPYVQKRKGDKISCYAVCPYCDNPVQIIGLYKKEDKTAVKPYGRHNKGSIYNLAEYSEVKYLNCPYSNPSYISGEYKKSKAGHNAFYDIMKDNFPCAIAVLEDSLSIRISYDLASDLLRGWMGNEAWRYYAANYLNLPYMLLYGREAITLWGRKIKKGGWLHKALAAYGGDIAFAENDDADEFVTVRSADEKFLDASFYIYKYRIVKTAEHIDEWLTFVADINGNTAVEKDIPVNGVLFQNLIRNGVKALPYRVGKMQKLTDEIVR